MGTDPVAMEGAGWKPYGTLWRDEPDALFCPACHVSGEGQDNLAGLMPVHGRFIFTLRRFEAGNGDRREFFLRIIDQKVS